MNTNNNTAHLLDHYSSHLDGQKHLSEHSVGEFEPDMSMLRDDSGTRYYRVRVDGREVRFVDVANEMESSRATVGYAVNKWRSRRITGLKGEQPVTGEVSQSHRSKDSSH